MVLRMAILTGNADYDAGETSRNLDNLLGSLGRREHSPVHPTANISSSSTSEFSVVGFLLVHYPASHWSYLQAQLTRQLDCLARRVTQHNMRLLAAQHGPTLMHLQSASTLTSKPREKATNEASSQPSSTPSTKLICDSSETDQPTDLHILLVLLVALGGGDADDWVAPDISSSTSPSASIVTKPTSSSYSLHNSFSPSCALHFFSAPKTSIAAEATATKAISPSVWRANAASGAAGGRQLIRGLAAQQAYSVWHADPPGPDRLLTEPPSYWTDSNLLLDHTAEFCQSTSQPLSHANGHLSDFKSSDSVALSRLKCACVPGACHHSDPSRQTGHSVDSLQQESGFLDWMARTAKPGLAFLYLTHEKDYFLSF
ncbi:unnamed protein product [Protopolystoma xenopodis]|uniref:Uncharacterized protein n=1 Tax=Protopolystoma xenopodis TaxID=117903 RepID=A0A3S5B4A1_9PLAT|nr:unnamed protein product [Protopolystoma xenopodis]